MARVFSVAALVSVVGFVLVPVARADAAAVPAAGQVRYRLSDPRLDEASGLAVGIRSPGVDYLQNDSGDSARFFAVDAATGATSAVVTVPGATNVDWEDLAVARDAAGTPSVWLADIGDNDATRSTVTVYRVPEPRIDPAERDRSIVSARPVVWRLRYPTGAVNAESLAVGPHGVAYIVTKSVVGESVVYRLPSRPDPSRVHTLDRAGAITFLPHATGQQFGEFGTVTATGAAISPSGELLAVRTYTDAYLWRISDGDVAAALRSAPVRVPLPIQPQGEGVAFDGNQLLLDSEGVRTDVLSVGLPSSVARSSGSAAETSASPVAEATTSPVAEATTSPEPSATPSRHPTSLAHGGSGGVAAVVLLMLFGGILYFTRKARRYGR